MAPPAAMWRALEGAHDAAQVDVDDLLPLRIAHLGQGRLAQQTCIGDGEVQPAEAVHGDAGQVLDLLGIAHIDRLHDAPPARAFDEFQGLAGIVRIPG